jgi:GlcNAc-P-P-Und epimerase
MTFAPGVHVYNYVDKPDFDMNKLIKVVRGMLGKKGAVGLRLPFTIGYAIGKCFDAVSRLTGSNYKVSAIRVKKFCANSVYSTAVSQTGFVAPVPIEIALEQTIRYEFLEQHNEGHIFLSE